MRNAAASSARSKALALACVSLLAVGCASRPANPDDPLEGYNRAMFSFNEQVDRAVLKPVAQGYDTVTPTPLRIAIGNVFSNIGDVWIGANNLLQGKPQDALSDGMRVLVNTFFGFAGILDIASEMGFTKHDEDFGQTLGTWGVGEGAYVVLPFFGPRTVRDSAGLALDLYADPVTGINDVPVRNSLTGLRVIDTRARLLGTERTVDEGTLDKYAYIRDFYLQQRRYKVNDGNPTNMYEDFDAEDDAAALGRGTDAAAHSAVERLELVAVGNVGATPAALAAAPRNRDTE